MKKKNKIKINIKFPHRIKILLSVIIVILSILLGAKIGWITEDYAPTLALFGLLTSIVLMGDD